MRLTLRTLLAYLDDLLPPAEARDLGRRVAESPAASQMMDRIREVMRRRRVEAPGLGDDPDANRVAEYLDNLLTPEETAEHERVCLASDPVLAETAASHQILTLALGQPVKVPSETRGKLLALDPQASVGGDSAMMPVVRTVPPPPPPPAAKLPKTPDASSGTRWGQWTAAAIVLLAAGGLFAWVLQSDDALTGRGSVAERRPDASAVVGGAADAAAELPAAAGDDAREADVDDGGPAVAMADDLTTRATGPDRATGDVPSDAADPLSSESTPDDGASDAAVAMVDSEEAASGEPAEDAVAPAADPPPPAVELADPFEWTFSDSSGVVLSPSEDAMGWAVQPGGQPFAAGREFAVPQPFTTTVVASGGPTDDATIEVRVDGGTRATVLGPDEATGGGLHLDRGRLAVRNLGDAAATMTLHAGRSFLLELGPSAVALAEVRPRVPAKIDGEGPSGVDAAVVLLSGVATATPADAEGPKLARAADDPPIGETVAGDDLSPQALADWAGRPDETLLTRRYSAAFAPLLPRSGAVDRVLPAALDEPVYRLSELAAEALSLLDEAASLVDGLRSQHVETRRASIRGLRLWLAEDPSRDEALEAMLSRRFRDPDAARMLTLIRGFTADDLRRPSVSTALIDDLASDDVAVREAAFAQVRRYADRDYDYRTNATAQSRTAAIRRWRDFLDEEGSIVRPSVEEPVVEVDPLE